MKASVTRGLLVAVTTLGCIAKGTSFDKSIVQLPAWNRVRAVPWASYSRKADLRNGLRWYPTMGIGTVLANIAAAIAVHRDPTARRARADPDGGPPGDRAHARHGPGRAQDAEGEADDDPDSLQKALEGFM